MSEMGRVTPKSLALVALHDALEEAARPVIRRAVMTALLQELETKIRAIDEDPRACLDLAEHVLERRSGLKSALDIARARRLAHRIQDAIEAFFEDEADEAEETP